MPPKREKGKNSASASAVADTPSSLEELLARVKKIEKDPSRNSEKNIREILGAIDGIFNAIPKNPRKQEIAEELIAEIQERCEALSTIRETKSAARKKEPMFGLIENYRESAANAVLPHDHPFCALGPKHEAVRAHLIPVQAVRSAAMRSEIRIVEDDDPETITKKQAFKRGLKGDYNHDKNDISNLVPCLIIPKHLEQYIDSSIKAYAIACSETRRRSINRPEETSTSAISNESEFAAQHPDVYLQIFGFLLETLPTGPSFSEKDKEQLVENFRTGVEILRDISTRVFPSSTGLFGTTLTARSRTRSETEGIDNFRLVEDGRPAPSLAEFIDLATAKRSLHPENIFIAKPDRSDHTAGTSASRDEDYEEKSPTGDVSPRVVRKGSVSGNNKPLVGGAQDKTYDDEEEVAVSK